MTETTQPLHDENQIIAERREKLAGIRTQGIAFPNDFERKDYAAEQHEARLARRVNKRSRPRNQRSFGVAF